VLAALLAATLLRALPLLENRFHPDEALYASFGRLIASGRDPMLSGALVDKPPLSFYLTALSFVVFGGTEFAARLVPFYASLVSVALVFGLARRLYDPLAAHLAAWALALSPFTILFSITLFVDTLLSALGLWGLWLLVRGRGRAPSRGAARWAGVAFALAFATKQTALVFAPLALLFMALLLPGPFWPALRGLLRTTGPVLAGVAISAVVVFGWDAARHAAVGFWQQGYSDNTPGRFVRATEVWPRALAWADWLHYFTASTALNGLLTCGLPLLLLLDWRRPSPAALADFLLAGYVVLYMAGYWLLAFNAWDRYLLPLMPALGLLLGRLCSALGRGLVRLALRLRAVEPKLERANLQRTLAGCLAAACLLPLAPSALTAAHSGYPVGGDHGAYDGLDDAAAFMRTIPPGGVLYDHWLGWEWNYYLFDGPLYVAWFSTPDALATDLRAFGQTSPRYLAVPLWESDAEVRAAAAQAGFSFVKLHTSYRRDGSASIVVYQLVSLPQPP
jgi:4-amino-4-deoxy-L-arabinose transferase-like glycosyltransferase